MPLIFIRIENCLIELWFSFESKIVHVNENENKNRIKWIWFESKNGVYVREWILIEIENWFQLVRIDSY